MRCEFHKRQTHKQTLNHLRNLADKEKREMGGRES